jgi:hypothetical protein
MQGQTPPITSGIKALFRNCIRRGGTFLFNQYLSALVGFLFVVPIVASVVTVTIYIIVPSLAWSTVLWGSAITLAIWLCVTFPLSHFTTASGANRRSYDLLIGQLTQLKTRLDALKEQQKQTNTLLPEYSQIALKEAEVGYTALYDSLMCTPGDLRWASGIGYLDAWKTLHEAEEALIEVEPVNMTLENAFLDWRRVHNSTMSSADELIDQLGQAVKGLDPAALVYFKEYRQKKGNPDLQPEMQQQSREISQIAKALAAVYPVTIDLQEQQPPVALPAPDEEVQDRARVALRQIRHTINEFRDTSWDGLLRVRNHLMFAMTLTGLVTYMLLCLVILIHASSPAIATASIFYIVGAIAGMFGRFYREANTRAAVDDYGLTVMRLFATPLLSGLAGVGGAFITLIFSGPLSPVATPESLSNLFYASPQLLVAAAVFGLAPNLIIKSLQQRAEKYASDLKSSKSTE